MSVSITPPAVVGILRAGDQPGPLELVEPVGHSTGRDLELAAQRAVGLRAGLQLHQDLELLLGQSHVGEASVHLGFELPAGLLDASDDPFDCGIDLWPGRERKAYMGVQPGLILGPESAFVACVSLGYGHRPDFTCALNSFRKSYI